MVLPPENDGRVAVHVPWSPLGTDVLVGLLSVRSPAGVGCREAHRSIRIERARLRETSHLASLDSRGLLPPHVDDLEILLEEGRYRVDAKRRGSGCGRSGEFDVKSCAKKTRPAVAPEAVFHPEFIEDLRHWVETDRGTALRALDLVTAVLRDPFRGVGKPEPLKYLLARAWSRRLTEEHRIVHAAHAGRIHFLEARYRY